MKELIGNLKHVRAVISVAIISNGILYLLDTPVSIIGILLQAFIEVQLLLVWYMIHAVIRTHSSHN